MSTQERPAQQAAVHADALTMLEAVEKGLMDQPAYAQLVIDVLGPDRAFRATLWLFLDLLKVKALQEHIPVEQVVSLMRQQLEGPPW